MLKHVTGHYHHVEVVFIDSENDPLADLTVCQTGAVIIRLHSYFSSAFFINISMIYQMDIINEKISKYLPKVPSL